MLRQLTTAAPLPPSSPVRRLLAVPLLLILIAVSALPGARPAGAALAVRIAATANFGGAFRAETWVPVTVTLANGGAGVSGEVVATTTGGGQPSARYVQRVELPTGSQKALTLHVRAEDGVRAIAVAFDTGKETVTAAPVALSQLRQGQQLVGIVADDAALAGDYDRLLAATYGSSRIVVASLAPDELPASTFGLDSFSALVVADATTGRWTTEQRAALAGWVARGGQLVVCGGANWRKITEGLGELPPLTPRESRTVTGLAGLAALGGATAPAGQWVLAAGDVLAGANRVADQDGLPLVASRAWGRGTVTSLAFDPGASAFTAWGGAGTFWRRLNLDTPLPASLQDSFVTSSGYLNPNGNYGPAQGQGVGPVTSVLRDLPSLSLPPTWVLGLILLLYIVVIGPVNYAILLYFDRRELAWVTIPALTIFFAVAIYATGAAVKGGSTTVNTVSIVRIAPGARVAEVQAFYGVLTPSRGLRDLAAGQEALFTGFSQQGLGISEDLGQDARFEQGGTGGVRRVSFAQWTQRTVAAQGMVDPIPLALRVDVKRDGAKIVGQVTNTSSEAIEDLYLLLDGAYERVGDLAPGASATVNWLPVALNTGGGSYYRPGLGTAIYGGYASGGQSQGVTGHRQQTLDALSGSVLAYRTQMGSGAPYNPYLPTATATPRPTPTATPRPGATPVPSVGGTRAGAGPLQVLFWRPDAPLDLKITAGERNVTTLVIQEVLLGVATQQGPAPVAAAGGAR